MKIAFYMEDGLEQIVLTPESEFEQKMLAKVHEKDRELTVYQGGFFPCNGGWTRHNLASRSIYDPSGYRGDESTILVLRPKPEEKL